MIAAFRTVAVDSPSRYWRPFRRFARNSSPVKSFRRRRGKAASCRVVGRVRPQHYVEVSQEIAKLGYDVVLFDGNAEEGTHGAGLTSAIEQAAAMPHALPGKVALVGFSLGGGESLYYGSQLPDRVAGVVACIRPTPSFATFPVLPAD